MIESIRLVGFKSFREKTIDLGNLTVLTGLNNSGKSSIIQAIRMGLAHCIEQPPYLDGLGGYQEIKSHLSPPGSSIEIELYNSLKQKTALRLLPEGYQYTDKQVSKFFQYISADRYGPRVRLPIIGDDVSRFTVGPYGQWSAHYANIFENIIVSESIRHPGSSSRILKHQLASWMSEIAPGVRLNFDVAHKYDASNLIVDGNRSTNSGFGISYTLPIVLALLTMTGAIGEDTSNDRLLAWFNFISVNSGILLVENPEAHLHPRGQTQIGRLMALAAGCGIQVIVETHSDYVLDGIRLAVKREETVKSSYVKIKFLQRDQENETELIDITLSDTGKIGRWPKGFFDQSSINLRDLSTS